MNKKDILQQNAVYEQKVAALLHSLAPYDDERLNRSPGSGRWSAMQVLHHLMLVESLALRYVQKKLSFQPKLEKAGLPEWFRLVGLWTYLHTPLKFRAPDAVGEQHLPAFASLEETRRQWQEVQAAWRAFLEAMPEEQVDKAVFRHPLVGRLSWTGTFAFFSAHLDRHRKQLWRTLRAV